ncbi:MAG: helix-turn-helix transcriptional regulator [Actinobacteria bacterium]|nr:helix-turn-helix transcriptional regulator [Actinomycetota bacterium]
METGWIVQKTREHAGISKRELARRAHTSPAAVVAYESGTRDPTVGTLERLVAATGATLVVEIEPVRHLDPSVSAQRLAEVLELADRLPRRRASRRLAYPPFPHSASPRPG